MKKLQGYVYTIDDAEIKLPIICAPDSCGVFDCVFCCPIDDFYKMDHIDSGGNIVRIFIRKDQIKKIIVREFEEESCS